MTTSFKLASSLVLLAATGGPALAGPSTADLCQIGRYQAAGQYLRCVEYWLAKGYAAPDQIRAGKCVAKYAASWEKLRLWSAVRGTACDNPRYRDDGATITDRLTGLDWEKKTSLDGTANPADPHDADNLYTWSATATASDGTAYTSFLRTLNDACFAGRCDWRLPTVAELLTIVEPIYPGCTIPLCIAPVFGPTSLSDDYWSASDHFVLPTSAWTLDFSEGVVSKDAKAVYLSVRAVRGGS